jgi:hypothetical protein
VSVVSDRAQISDLSASLVNTACKDWMTLENLATDMPLTEDFAQPPLPTFSGQVRCRSIYDAGSMDDPVARRIIQACTGAGEQARLLPSVPMKMKLADHATALLSLTPTGVAGMLVIRAPVIISALCEYFELLWDRATPLRPQRSAAPAGRLTAAQQTILTVMARDSAMPPSSRKIAFSPMRSSSAPSVSNPARRHACLSTGSAAEDENSAAPGTRTRIPGVVARVKGVGLSRATATPPTGCCAAGS